jgi:uncharacterized protein (DUF433 family)
MIGRVEESAVNWHERIERKPSVMLGKPVIRGTRVTVEQLLRELATGMTPEQIVEEHPGLHVEDVRASQAFAADYLAGEDVEFA